MVSFVFAYTMKPLVEDPLLFMLLNWKGKSWAGLKMGLVKFLGWTDPNHRRRWVMNLNWVGNHCCAPGYKAAAYKRRGGQATPLLE